jgi:hypothetical protein
MEKKYDRLFFRFLQSFFHGKQTVWLFPNYVCFISACLLFFVVVLLFEVLMQNHVLLLQITHTRFSFCWETKKHTTLDG